MLDNGPDGQGKCTKSFVSGDSAGGGLSLGVTLSLKDDGSQLPDAVMSLCPWAELDPVSESYETNASNDPYWCKYKIVSDNWNDTTIYKLWWFINNKCFNSIRNNFEFDKKKD